MEVIAYLVERTSSDFIKVLETGTIRSYEEKHESTRWFGESIKNGSIISIDNCKESIEISKDICKHLDNITWVESDSVEYLKTLDQDDKFDIILLDSDNDKNLIWEEFKLAIKLIKTDGIIMINDFGVTAELQIPDLTHIYSEKGWEVWRQLCMRGLAPALHIHKGKYGTQGCLMNISDDFKNRFTDEWLAAEEKAWTIPKA